MLTERQSDVVSALAFASMNVSEATRMLGCARNNVLWHIAKIKEKTGLNPLDFFDLYELYRSMELSTKNNGGSEIDRKRRKDCGSHDK